MIIPSYHKASNRKLSGTDTPLDRFIVEYSPVPPEHTQWMQMLQEVVDHVDAEITHRMTVAFCVRLNEIESAKTRREIENNEIRQQYLVGLGMMLLLCIAQTCLIFVLTL